MIHAIETKCDICKVIFTVMFLAGTSATPIQYCPFCGVTIDTQHLVVLQEDTVNARTDLEDSLNDLLSSLPFKLAPFYDESTDTLVVLLENVAYVEQAACPHVILFRAKDDRRVVGMRIWDVTKLCASHSVSPSSTGGATAAGGSGPPASGDSNAR